VIVIEDNENGIKAATQAGAHVLRVSDPSEVDLERIHNFITEIEAKNCNP
jgi:beta-phosphoglucomutase-like phosphatase (HAD superfamily)